MVRSTPAFSSGGCPGGNQTLHRAKQDQVKDLLQAEEPSCNLVRIITHALAFLHPSKARSSSKAGSIHEESQAVHMGLASERRDKSLQHTEAKWLPEASSKAGLSRDRISSRSPACCLLPVRIHPRTMMLLEAEVQTAKPQTPLLFSPGVFPTLCALPGLGGQPQDAQRTAVG